MEYALLLFIAMALAAGVAGGLIAAWSCHRRVLVLEETFKLVVVSLEDRLKQVTAIAVRQDKSEAAKTRWSKEKVEQTSLLKTLTDDRAGGGSVVSGHPWDPRTWGVGN